ncbi:Zn-ribbon domain-containing OB-fold protein (plasmid) [Rhodococcus opacus]|uniref:Zn-ribbon domain-containing OB-fold protein n=1 Tax=Rhodococcus opacus TaxID=37919 RepID=UPI0034D33889
MTTTNSLRQWSGQMPVASPETKPFWDACNEERFLLQKCPDCGRFQYHYRAFCSHCWSRNIEDYVSAGHGTIWTYSVVKKNRTPGYEGKTPYVVAIVELEGGTKVFGNVVDLDPDDAHIGMPVELIFAVADTGQKIPLFSASHPSAS